MHKFILIFTDATIIIASYIISLLVRFGGFVNVAEHQWYTLIFLLFLIPAIFYFSDLYNHLSYTQRLKVFFKIIRAWLVALLIYVILGFLTKFAFLIDSRAFIVGFFGFFLILTYTIRLILGKKILEYYFTRTNGKISCKYVGKPDKFTLFDRFFKNNVVTGLTLMKSDKIKNPHRNHNVSFLYSRTTKFNDLYKEIRSNISPGTTLHVASLLFNRLNLGWEWCNIDSIPVYTFHQKKNQFCRDCIRRFLDIVGSLIGLVVSAPFFIIISIAIKLDSRGPVIFKQKRCGRDGEKFTFYKFRSMYASVKKESENRIKLNNYIKRRTPKVETINYEDITDIGWILRKTSVDEWPQLINVLKGEMSLIGPRPPLPEEVKYYKDWHKDRLLVKQGLTGLWQIYGRGEMPCDKSIFLDLIYVINRSISLDLKLIFQTIPAVILGKGAY